MQLHNVARIIAIWNQVFAVDKNSDDTLLFGFLGVKKKDTKIYSPIRILCVSDTHGYRLFYCLKVQANNYSNNKCSCSWQVTVKQRKQFF